MNLLCFFSGAGIGALLTTVIFLIILDRLSKQHGSASKNVIDTNNQSIKLLEARNVLGERQVAALEKIASLSDPEKL